ncbi:MAG: TetR/AcrR family transcriptional regulator [Acidimicrobiia bacterium]|nr:TetR/AcrR family transcriptional regulator [Acidimicrobiia bacterium]MDH4364188.1 TetR/AcrR family transcriptional regulator [Acidimicrobiia bacterium]
MKPKTPRRSRQGQESRQRILDATFEIAHEQGYQGTSIAKVSARSGLPASSVYWHFADKDALFAEVIQYSFDQWEAAMPLWTPPRPGERRAEALVVQIRSAIDSIATSPEFWRLGLMLSLERQPVEPQARARFLEIRQRVQAGMARWWAEVLPEGHRERSPGLPELLARFTMAASDGIFISVQVDDERADPAEAAATRARLAQLLADSLEAAALRLGGGG